MSNELEQPIAAIPVEENGQHTKRARRSRKQVAEEAVEQGQREAAETNGHGGGEVHADEHGREWAKIHDHWRDEEAGVRMERNRQDGLHTIIARDPLPREAVELMEERGFVRDDEVGGYSLKISALRPRGSMELAEETVKDVANLVRAEKGMDLKESFFLSRG
jgi:hypothetical protein